MNGVSSEKAGAILPKKRLAGSIRKATLQMAFSAAMLGVAGAAAADIKEVNKFSIDSQPLNAALAKFSSQASMQLVVSADNVRQFTADALTGSLSNEDALSQLLKGTGLTYEIRNGDTILIKQAEDADEGADEEVDEEILVTGSRLATNSDNVAGQFIRFDSEYIKASGETTLERFLRRLPQNFQGTTEFAGSQLNNATNLTGASTVNLRGFGSNSTLILVDGRRRGSNGLLGGVTDISGIPLSQVERIEVMLDGASAIYGSDAVGGVVNIITKKDYQGVIAGIEYTEPDSGTFNEYKFTLSGGFGWDDGNLRINYEYGEHTGLVADESQLGLVDPQTAALNLFNTPRPGFAPQAVGSSPLFYNGNGMNITVAAFDALTPAEQAAYTGVSIATLPIGFNESSDLNDIVMLMATDNSVTGTGEADAGTLLLPERKSHAIGFTLSQDLGDNVSLFSTLNYSTRDTTSGGAIPSVSSRVNAGNPFNPFGETFAYVGLLPNVDRNFNFADSDQWDFTLGLKGDLNDNWSWSADGSYSRSTVDAVTAPRLDGTALANGLNSDGVTPRTLFVPAGSPAPEPGCTFAGSSFGNDRYSCPALAAVNPFGDLSSFLLPPQNATNRNELTIIGANVKGTLFSLPGGDVSVVVGAEWQRREINSASEFSVSAVDTTSVGPNPFDASISRDSQAAFVEGLVPIVGDGNSLPLVQSLNLTFSGRYDSYDSPDATRNIDVPLDLSDPLAVEEFNAFNTPVAIGGDSTWGSGLIWTLNDQVKFRANWQTAFLAPQLNQLFRSTDPRFSRGFAFIFVEQPDGSLSFRPFDQVLGGGNPQLENENSRSRTFSLEFTPDFAPGLTASIAHAETKYINRIGSLDSNGAIVPLVDFQNNMFPSDFLVELDDDGNLVSLGLDTRLKNTAIVERGGIDARLNYIIDSDLGQFVFDLSLAKINKQNSRPDVIDDDVPVVAQSADSRFRPVPENSVDLQFSWVHRGMTAALSANQRSNTERLTLTSAGDLAFVETTRSADTVNLTLSYDFENGDLFSAPGWMEGMVCTLGIENLTDQLSESSRLNVGTGELTVSRANALTALGRGRVFNFRLQKEF